MQIGQGFATIAWCTQPFVNTKVLMAPLLLPPQLGPPHGPNVGKKKCELQTWGRVFPLTVPKFVTSGGLFARAGVVAGACTPVGAVAFVLWRKCRVCCLKVAARKSHFVWGCVPGRLASEHAAIKSLFCSLPPT